jgi:hypothetical protein
MTSGFHGKVQRTFWISKMAAEKFRRLVAARGGRCGAQVAEEAINLLYKLDPLMADQVPIPSDEIGPSRPKAPAEPRDPLDTMLDLAQTLRRPRP